MGHLVIAISREFGSNGREIGELVAKRLGISYYDKVLLQLAAERSGLSPEFMERNEEQASSSFLFNLSTAAHSASNFFYQYDVPLGDKAFFAQAEVMRELAEREACVIVGRCADYVLRNHDRCLKIFLRAPLDHRVEQVARILDLTPDEAKARTLRMDKGRANYYRHYTGEPWGTAHNYDLTVNTALSGTRGAVDVICTMARAIEEASTLPQ